MLLKEIKPNGIGEYDKQMRILRKLKDRGDFSKIFEEKLKETARPLTEEEKEMFSGLSLFN